MKIGDLVCLSYYGRQRNYNLHLTMKDPDQVGIITAVTNGNYCYKVRWTKSNHLRPSFGVGHTRRELKYAHIHKSE